MKTTLYYFSATGNSLSLARNLANELGNCEIVSIAQAITSPVIETTAENIGIIFPVYAWGLPRIISEFVEKLSADKSGYVFAVATCVAIPGNTLPQLKSELKSKGIPLHAGFFVKAGISSLIKRNALDNIVISLDSKRKNLKDAGERLHEIAAKVKDHEHSRPETSDFAANIIGSLFHRMAIRSFKTKDQEFFITKECTRCGTCAKVCPRKNITLAGDGPAFKQNCELCHACIQWCPQFAIRHKDFDPALKQYRNPEVSLSDIVTHYIGQW